MTTDQTIKTHAIKEGEKLQFLLLEAGDIELTESDIKQIESIAIPNELGIKSETSEEYNKRKEEERKAEKEWHKEWKYGKHECAQYKVVLSSAGKETIENDSNGHKLFLSEGGFTLSIYTISRGLTPTQYKIVGLRSMDYFLDSGMRVEADSIERQN